MTKVTFFKREDGLLDGFEASGHSGYGVSGSDIVCAAISALTQAAAGGISEVVKAPAETRTDEDMGYFSCFLGANAAEEKRKNAQILLETLKMALEAISKDYPGTIRIILRERR